ncbi:MAG: pyridoxamine 5'-phosphate oxidase family protein [Erysipelotrichaceae bacterium]|nr:pyridoxamine 5'-phosphate oxidase family protein [Erysipelotrichaceae bacterium]
MFRPLNRIKQALSEEECLEIMKNELRGVLSLNGEGGYPYGVPINHFYNEEDGCLYFHGGKVGYKIDMIRENNKASFCVMDKGVRDEKGWWLNIRSVIAFGKIEFVEDEDMVADISRKLSLKFTDDEEFIAREIQDSLKTTLMFRMKIEHLSGKRVREK